ncbi:unnamed protein product [Phytophthora lilii]|uniref:Unnamed protein product n=1 Tax=Phytophthora lilii TaxID=2077276 RepID=A0A9W6U5F4_9STRA|nr:unnamed protein product [Phytophthora lilii]
MCFRLLLSLLDLSSSPSCLVTSQCSSRTSTLTQLVITRKWKAFATMEKMCLPNKLQERVHQYYTHVWTEYRSLDGDIVKFQRELAHTLGLEVGLYNYMNLVMRIPFWESCSPDFATQIILNLAIRVYLPDDYIVRKGDTGDEMFMINRGICELSDPAKSQDPRNVAILESTASGSSEKFSAADNGMDNERESSEDKAKAGDTDVDRASSLLSHSKIGHKSIFRRSSTSTDKRAQVYPQKNKYEISPGEEASTKKSLKQILLYPGQAFGEMSLLMNYKRTANIRAATYVEICVFSRESFQRIISRYPEDRRHHGTFGSSRLNVQATATATEAAQALVDRIDVNRPDESIKYGFQTFHPDLTSASPRASVDDPVSSVSSNRRLRRNSLSKTVNSYSADEHFQHKAEITATQPPAESRIDGLEKALATMMNVVNSMAASMERLERLAQSRETVCCCGSSLRGSAKQSDCGGEARGADYTDVSPRTKIRRRKGSSNLFTDIQKSVDSSSGMASISNMPDKAKRNNVEVSRLGSLCQMEFSEAPLGIGSLEPALMVSSSAVVRQMSGIEVMNDACDPLSYDMPAQAQGWLPKTTSPEKDLTIAEQLWRRQKPVKRKIKKMSDYGKSATVARLKSQSALLRTRSSVPSNFKSSATAGHHEGQDISTLLGFGVEHHKTKRRGSRIGIDAFTVQATHDTDTSKSFTSRSCDDHCTQ